MLKDEDIVNQIKDIKTMPASNFRSICLYFRDRTKAVEEKFSANGRENYDVTTVTEKVIS